MFELLRAKRLAEVAREHYDRAAGLMRTQHYQFCLQEAQNTWNVALIEWQNKQWTHASRSLSALARHLLILQYLRTHANERWLKLSESADYWAREFGKGSNGKYLAYDEILWFHTSHAYTHELQAEITSCNPLRGASDDSQE